LGVDGCAEGERDDCRVGNRVGSCVVELDGSDEGVDLDGTTVGLDIDGCAEGERDGS
jgi:hypothetical protein